MSRWRHSCACSSGLWGRFCSQGAASLERRYERLVMNPVFVMSLVDGLIATIILSALTFVFGGLVGAALALARISPLQPVRIANRSEEHTSELHSLMRISYAVFRLKKQHTYTTNQT